MIDTEIKKLGQAVREAVRTAKIKQKPQLLSITEPLAAIDPFSFFDNAEKFTGGRIFWNNSAEGHWLAGAGEALALTAADHRFEETERQWKEMLENALIHNPHRVPGTGPIAFGGFSFDPDKETTPLWADFNSSLLRVPAYLLTMVNGDCFLTCNVVIYEYDQPEQIELQVENHKKQLLKQQAILPEGPVITDKQEIEPDSWKQLVRNATNTIKQGKAEKIVLAREMKVFFKNKVNVSPILRQLADMQTNSYIFAFENGEDCFLGATPERLVKVENQQLLSTCLAGTAPRGRTEAEDRKIGGQLLSDEKNRQEHHFVVEMIKKAVAACCENVQVPEAPVLYPLKNLQHLYTPVEAVLNENYTIIDIVKRLHPTPALGGMPSEKSVAFIREHENMDRGWYGAPIGWLDANHNGEFAVAIRSALIRGGEASLFAGCGVVRDSDPEAEYQETNIKFTPMLSVLGGRS
ncbi:isochorismate synthase [Sediminibacillus albus]|uniref:Isochorismate synthase MenF n=1 Tax=Sediminibacillus albus TaxID=407036 RepID=A0A1G8Z2X0_9BACI|nr:isochorismate synthase [Sediminibacillus albus]SDK08590.1 menaquinone-specific isochorismate synthase [Sediminibacillus albus]